MLAFIHVEELHFLQEFLLCLISGCLNLGKLNTFINEQGEVAAHSRELRQVVVGDGHLLDEFHEVGPVDVGEINRSLDVEFLCHLLGHNAKLSNLLAATLRDGGSHREDVVLLLAEDKGTERNTQTLEDVEHVCLHLIHRRVLVGMCPVAVHTLTCQPKTQVVVLAVSSQNLLRRLGTCLQRLAVLVHLLLILLRVEIVAVAELEELQVGHATIAVAGNGLKTTEEQRLTQHCQVLAQRVHQFHTVLQFVSLTIFIVRNLGERVVQYLIEATAHQLFSHVILQFVALVQFALYGER